jgi:hypothetical protein
MTLPVIRTSSGHKSTEVTDSSSVIGFFTACDVSVGLILRNVLAFTMSFSSTMFDKYHRSSDTSVCILANPFFMFAVMSFMAFGRENNIYIFLHRLYVKRV